MSNTNYQKWVELQGYYLRRYLRLSSCGWLDHLALAATMNVKILSVRDVPFIPEAVVSQLLSHDRCGWSAGCLRLPEGYEFRAVILFNPTHAITRQRATIMEELSHLHLKHKGSKLGSTGGCGIRSYKKSEESQAYFVGAAALLPAAALEKAQLDHTTRKQLAYNHNISHELVIFREKITGIKLT